MLHPVAVIDQPDGHTPLYNDYKFGPLLPSPLDSSARLKAKRLYNRTGFRRIEAGKWAIFSKENLDDMASLADMIIVSIIVV